ncbi:hypothetical protein ALQ08_200050 [Pseudomonas syringae pv. delphinii]|uniref:Uncharacterized protein n=1 Tax=Pseudomonas syringae pv. delphinii TaxID=192088 RepID=A0A3M4KF35_9PSED|nr:hypothetical protein ALQ08_200050 [Pseudomonas syringae pv. delphinii]
MTVPSASAMTWPRAGFSAMNTEIVLARRGGLAPFDVPVLLDQDAEVVLFGGAALAATAVAGEPAEHAQHGLARVAGKG